MNDLWLKIRVWTKAVLIVLVLIYALFFIFNNYGQPVRFWFFFGAAYTTDLLLVVVFTFVAGVVVTVLARTALRTVRQIRDLQQRKREQEERGRSERMERELADMKAKAARLNTREEASPPPKPSPPPEQP